MVFQKRLNYGSSSCQVPTMPFVPRSARGKRSVRKKTKDNLMCAFDLLATVAGRLLSERENSCSALKSTETLSSNAAKETTKEEEINTEKLSQTEALDQQSCNDCVLGSEFLSKREIDYELKEVREAYAGSLDSSVFVKPNISNKDVIAEESIIDEPRDIKGGLNTPLSAEDRVTNNVIDGNIVDMYSLEPMDLDGKPPSLISCDSSGEVPVYSNNITRKCSFIKHEDVVELSIAKDDDENSSGCTHPSILPNKAYRPQRMGDRRIKKLLASRHWEFSPAMPHDTELSDYEADAKPNFIRKKMFYTRQRRQSSSFKKRKLFSRRSVSACDGSLCQKHAFNLCGKAAIKQEASDLHCPFQANWVSSSTAGQKSSHKSSECHVKLSIKSFKVPELFIEIPENATVGSLKKTVLETVTALLVGGLHVGVLLQGKKIRDDSQTLRQVGLSPNDKIDCLGITLEPNSTHAPAVLTAPGDHQLPSLGQPVEPLDRMPPIDPPADLGPDDANQPLILTSCTESDHDSVHSPADALQLDNAPVASQALVAVPLLNADGLAMVPLRKPRRSEVGQRRIRRPFTVVEVEALVQAVEKLGTGRWRDVKLRAFEHAKHRTYVDLKDKWKTLVHTARISPQQRRGEPLPQELLDRVLLAHAYWSQQQVKLHVKPPPRMPLAPAESFLLH